MNLWDRLYLGLYNRRTFSTFHWPSLPTPHLLATQGNGFPLWPALKSFWVSFLMTIPLSSLNFLLLYIIGLTFSSIVSLWHKKLGSMSGISAEVHAKAFRCLAITSTIWSTIFWPSDEPSLNFFPLISLSWTLPIGSGRPSLVASARVVTSGPCAWAVTTHIPLLLFRLFS